MGVDKNGSSVAKGNESDSFKKLKLNLGLGFVAKFGSFILSYISLPLALNYLGSTYYGVWVVIFSILSWIYNFDVGIGLGLKNKLNEAVISKDYKKANALISTSYLMLGVITFIILILSLISLKMVNLNEELNASTIGAQELNDAVMISIIFTLSNFILLLYKQLFAAINRTGFVGTTTIVYQLIVIASLLYAKNFLEPSLVVVSIIYGLANVIVGLLFTTLFFWKESNLKLSLFNFKKEYIKDIIGIGGKFFAIQMCMVVIFTCDNLLIAKFLGPDYVTTYSLILKTYQGFIMINYIILTPYWTLFSEAYYKEDFKWIKNTFKKLSIIFSIICILVVIYSFSINFFLQLWLGRTINYTGELIFYFAIFVIIRTVIDIFSVFLNGVSKLNLQLILYIFAAIINIPLSIYFIKSWGMGSEAVALSTLISILPMAIFLPMQVFKIVKNKK